MNDAPILVFDIETIPCLDTGRRLYPELNTLNDDQALNALIHIREAEAGNSFMRHPLHKVACLSFLWIDNDALTLKSLSLNHMHENDILCIFLRAFAKKPILVSWNGASFDLPVLLYRMAHHNINAAALTQAANKNQDYLNRYSDKHIDLMEKFSFGVWNNKQKLDTIAALCGIAGKGDVDGAQVLPMVQAGNWEKLTTYCESDVINTWLLYLRWQQLNGKIDNETINAWQLNTEAFLAGIRNEDGSMRHGAFLTTKQTHTNQQR